MTPERLREIERLFHEARERPPAERDAFLARACARRSRAAARGRVAAGAAAGRRDRRAGWRARGRARRASRAAARARLVGRSVSHRGTARRRRHGRGLSRARHAALGRDVAIKILPRRVHGRSGTAGPLRARGARARRRSIIRTSARSTASRTPTASRRWCSSWSKARRSPIGSQRGPMPVDRGAARSRVRSPRRSTRRTRRASSTAISSRRTSRSRPDGVVKVLDFGLAKAATGEVADRRRVDRRAARRKGPSSARRPT